MKKRREGKLQDALQDAFDNIGSAWHSNEHQKWGKGRYLGVLPWILDKCTNRSFVYLAYLRIRSILQLLGQLVTTCH